MYINLQLFLFKASKEWRVVTDYLERLCSNVKTGTDSLVQVSTGIFNFFNVIYKALNGGRGGK